MVKDHTDNERGRKEMFLFNDALNTFYLRRQAYGKGPFR